MSTLREHVDALLALRRPDKTRQDERQFELQGWLIVTAHLDELVALLDLVSRPAPCAAKLIAGAWQCDHCGNFSLDAPKCAHAAAPAVQTAVPKPASAQVAEPVAWQQVGWWVVFDEPNDEGTTPGGFCISEKRAKTFSSEPGWLKNHLVPLAIFSAPGAVPSAQHAAPPSDRLSVDARRYRWLRQQNWHEAALGVVMQPKQSVKLGYDCPSMDRLDEAIDAAMQQGDAS